MANLCLTAQAESLDRAALSSAAAGQAPLLRTKRLARFSEAKGIALAKVCRQSLQGLAHGKLTGIGNGPASKAG